MYTVNVIVGTETACSFQCNAFTESYDNEVKRKSLTFNNKEKAALNSFIANFTPIEDAVISKIVVMFKDEKVIEYDNYKVYARASIEFPENNPDDAQGVVTFAIE